LELSKLNVFEMGMAPEDFCWGSCMVVTNRGILWSLAYELTGKECYAEAVQSHVDYLFGKNATLYSYVTGFGENAYKHPHSRPLQVDGIDEPVPGLVSGGANGHPGDPEARKLLPPGTAPMKCFVDVWESYSTNEITIYWNSSAIYTTAFLRR
jgi:endoglucanase